MSDTTWKATFEDTYEEHPELAADEAEWFDLTPVEKKLCAASLGLGVVLLGVFLTIFEGL